MEKSRQAQRTAAGAIAALPSRAAISLFCAFVCAIPYPVHAQGTEMEQILFVQAPEGKTPNATSANGSGGIEVIWIPEPLIKFCLGKTASQCAAMDFCIRTTSKQVKMCQNLAIPLSRLPAYPRDMTPRRMMSLTFYKLTPGGPYQPLVDAYKSLPRASLERLSLAARIKARVRFTRGDNDDDFQLEQVLAAAPF
jgi:hypothetical protein